jgi:hypothetical protein
MRLNVSEPNSDSAGASGDSSQVEYWRAIAEELRPIIANDIYFGHYDINDYEFTPNTHDFILDALIDDGNP